MKYLLNFLIPLAISLALYLPVKLLAKKFNLYAKTNERTIHKGLIPRIGGIMIYFGFIIYCYIQYRGTKMYDGIFVGATIIFIEGLLDDIFDIKPIFKIIGQVLAACAVVFIGGVYIQNIHLLFGIEIKVQFISYLITFIWIIGIINAINLIDGLDGLAGGFSIIILFTIAILSYLSNDSVVVPLCLALAGSTFGFLIFNFNPAKIFMGDCGSQLLGLIISSVALSGLKKTTAITLGVPVILLLEPIADTFLAIIRRKLKGQSIMVADKLHLHHVLMNNMKLGQKGAVAVIYTMAALCGVDAYLVYTDKKLGIMMLIFLIIIFEIFIEHTGMISTKYRPILSIFDKFKVEDDNN